MTTSPLQAEAMRLRASGLTYKQIAARLGMPDARTAADVISAALATVSREQRQKMEPDSPSQQTTAIGTAVADNLAAQPE